MLKRKGVTLLEMMIAVAVVTIGVMGSMGAFKYINQSITQSRLKSIAANLAQERMEVLKNKSYYQLLVTTYSVTSSGYSPDFVYDNGNYPPEVITMWGFPALTRAINVDYASVYGGGVSTVPYSSNDTGMKKITVYISWAERGVKKKIQLDSYYQNSSVSTLSTGFNGQVTVSTGGALAGALVQVSGSPRWRGYSNSAGNYSFQVAPGTYSLVCSSAGFFSQGTEPLTVNEGAYTTQPFSLTRIATGTVGSASVYTTNPGLVISQVVVETNTWVNDMLGNSSVEYIELFNPTTSPINIGVTGNPNIRIDYDCEAAGQDRAHGAFNFVFISTYVPSGSYYLLASATAFMINGSMINADACFGSAAGCDTIPTFPDHLDNNRAGAIRLSNYLDNASYDTVGWNDNNNDACVDPGFCEGTSIPNNTANGFDGMQAGNQIVRFSSACAVGITYGRAYDTDNNANDFYYNNTAASGIVYRPFNSSSPAQTVISGRPSTGAYVLANDGNSAGALSCEYSVTGPQGQVCAMSSFTVVGVATGTWTVAVMTENSSQTISNVVVSQGLLTTIPNGSTSPSWPDSGFYNTVLSSAYMGGFAGGMVFGVGPDYFKRINGILMCASDGSPPSRTDSQGFYVLNLTTGITVITANCNSDNGSYTSDNAVATIAEGAVTTIPAFHLAQGGVIKGYVTPGLGALPNIPVLATLGTAVYEDTTDNTGYFYIFAATAAAAYTITPILDPLQSYTSLPGQPLTSSVTVPGDTVFAGTVTVIGALGTITGSVSANGSPITTGVLVVASTGTVPDPMPAITAATSPSLTIFYAVSSKSDGMYSLEVRASTTSTYNVRFFYPVVDIKTGIAASPTPSKLITGISVGAGAATPDQNFTWP